MMFVLPDCLSDDNLELQSAEVDPTIVAAAYNTRGASNLYHPYTLPVAARLSTRTLLARLVTAALLRCVSECLNTHTYIHWHVDTQRYWQCALL